jgi:hemoglobin-like flavoprotein
MDQQDLKLFRESLDRVSVMQGFFDDFYDHFMAESDEIAGFFLNRDMAQLKKKLQDTLQMVADTVEDKPGLSLYIELLGRIHQRLKVERRHFTMWQAALVDTVALFDDQYDKRTEMAWNRVIGHVIDLLFSGEDPSQQEAS